MASAGRMAGETGFVRSPTLDELPHIASITIGSLWSSSASSEQSSLMCPIGLTALAARGSVPNEAGVGPKKMQNAVPGGQ